MAQSTHPGASGARSGTGQNKLGKGLNPGVVNPSPARTNNGANPGQARSGTNKHSHPAYGNANARGLNPGVVTPKH